MPKNFAILSIIRQGNNLMLTHSFIRSILIDDIDCIGIGSAFSHCEFKNI
jgi:hypothetical protein